MGGKCFAVMAVRVCGVLLVLFRYPPNRCVYMGVGVLFMLVGLWPCCAVFRLGGLVVIILGRGCVWVWLLLGFVCGGCFFCVWVRSWGAVCVV